MHTPHAFGERRLVAFSLSGNTNMPPFSGDRLSPSEAQPGSLTENADQRLRTITNRLDPNNTSVRTVERYVGMERSIREIREIKIAMQRATLEMFRIDTDQAIPLEEKRPMLERLTTQLQDLQTRLERSATALGNAWLLNLEGKTIDLPEGGTAKLKNFTQAGDVISCDVEYAAPNGLQTRHISLGAKAGMGIGLSMTENLANISPNDAERAATWLPLFRSPQDVGLPSMIYQKLLER